MRAVGMGKTMVCTALILANPSPAMPSGAAYAQRFEASAPVAKYKTTLVVCPPTLVQQWQDEIAQHAPQLTVAVHYSSPAADADTYERYSVTVRKPAVEGDELVAQQAATRLSNQLALHRGSNASRDDDGAIDAALEEELAAAREEHERIRFQKDNLPFTLKTLADGTVTVEGFRDVAPVLLVGTRASEREVRGPR